MRTPTGDAVTLDEIRIMLEEEAVHGVAALLEARRKHRERAIGYWTAYIETRERLIVILAELVDDDRL